MQKYGPDAILAMRYKALLELLAAVIIIVAIRRSHSDNLIMRSAVPLIFGFLSIAIPRAFLEPIAPQIESLINLSTGVFQIANGIAPLVLFGCLVCILYWCIVPIGWRNALLAIASIVALIFLGASLEFAVLSIVVVLITQTASSRIQTEPANDTANRPVQIVAFFFILLIELLAFIAALWTGLQTTVSSPIVLSSLFLMTIFLAPLSISKLTSLNLRGMFPAKVTSAPDLPTVQVILGFWALWIAGHYVPLALNIIEAQLGFIVLLAYLGVFLFIALRIIQRGPDIIYRRMLAYITIFVILLALVLGKSPFPLVSASLVGWIGFSYLAFRLLHILLDSINKRYHDASSLEMLIYTLFYPALLVGPIDRLPRFLKDLRAKDQRFSWKYIVAGLIRIAIGATKKFLLADILLAPLALGVGQSLPYSTTNAWMQVISYSFYILLDFSGYVDIVLGLGFLVGFTLPENFDSPYLKTNLVQFWQAWHITLSNWLRTYVFFPLSGRLLRTSLRKHPNVVAFTAQMTTMLLIGLWHGITVNFALWGLWHGIGLFLHKLYSDRSKRYTQRLSEYPTLHSLYGVGGWAVTFTFVSLGWVFFALPNLSASKQVFQTLFNMR